MFLTALDIRNEGYVDENAVFSAHLKRYLTDSLKERLAFDITYRTADFCDDNICVCLFTYVIYK